MGHNKPPKALATAAQCGEALSNEASLTKNKNDATATRYKLFLMLTCSNATMAQDMFSQWKSLPVSNAQNAETRERGRTVKDTLFGMFNVPKLPTKEEKDKLSAEQLDKMALMQKNCLETVHLCAYVHEMHYETMFRFNEQGGVYVKHSTPLADRIWTAKKWSEVPALMEADKADIQIMSTTWYADKGRSIAWSDLKTILISEGGRKGPAARKTISDANVSEAMQTTRMYYETNAPTANELPAIRSSIENALAVVKLSLRPVMNAATLIASVDALSEAIFAVIGKGAPEVKVDGGTGNVVKIAEHNAKHDVVTPESAKELPSKAK
jgi:hypothetical protein